MAYDEQLAQRVKSILQTQVGFTEKKMFGGAGFMYNGNMICGIYKEFLILRLAIEIAEDLLKQDHVRVFDITGRPMKGWVMIAPEGCRNDSILKERIASALEFVKTLPAK